MLFKELETERIKKKNISTEDRDFIFAEFSKKYCNLHKLK